MDVCPVYTLESLWTMLTKVNNRQTDTVDLTSSFAINKWMNLENNHQGWFAKTRGVGSLCKAPNFFFLFSEVLFFLEESGVLSTPNCSDLPSSVNVYLHYPLLLEVDGFVLIKTDTLKDVQFIYRKECTIDTPIQGNK